MIPNFCRICLLFTGMVVAASAQAQAWPSKPVKLIVPFPAGGPTDLVGREAGMVGYVTKPISAPKLAAALARALGTAA